MLDGLRQFIADIVSPDADRDRAFKRSTGVRGLDGHVAPPEEERAELVGREGLDPQVVGPEGLGMTQNVGEG